MSTEEQIRNAVMNIRTIRLSKGISAVAIKDSCGLRSAKRMSDLEEGRGALTLDELISIADFLEVSIDGLLKKKVKISFE